MIESAHGLNVGAVVAPFEQGPYREPRLGSGVLCPGKVDDIECESPLTTRMRGGVDLHLRPIAEYLCETCGTRFTAITVSLEPGVRFEDVAVPDDDWGESAQPITVMTALRRGERIARAGKAAPQPQVRTCSECGAPVVGGKDWEYHQRRHFEGDLT